MSSYSTQIQNSSGKAKTSTATAIANLEEGLCVAARLVEFHGDEYWPTFKRLDIELRDLKKRSKRLSRYRRLNQLKKDV